MRRKPRNLVCSFYVDETFYDTREVDVADNDKWEWCGFGQVEGVSADQSNEPTFLCWMNYIIVYLVYTMGGL